MLGVTLFGIFLTPVFYYVIVRMFPAKPTPAVEQPSQPSNEHGQFETDGAAHPQPSHV
jgi:hypothetical protein